MDTSLVDRLKEFIGSTSYNNSQFADRCSIPRPSLSQILTGRNKKVSNQILDQIHAAFPELSMMWLLFGEGDMLVSDPDKAGRQIFLEDDIPEPYENARQNPEIQSSGSGNDNFSKENGLTSADFVGKSVDSQLAMSNLQIQELQSQIAKLNQKLEVAKQNPRKVIQITIYYDDSTFESFTP